jgi:hypothetical protein
MATVTNPVAFQGITFKADTDTIRDTTGAIVPDLKPNDPALFAGKCWYSVTVTCQLPDKRLVIFKASKLKADAEALTVATP